MSDISHIKSGGVTYSIKDSLARQNIDLLSSELSGKIYVKNGDAEYDNLSVVKLPADEYYQNVADHVLSDNCLYVLDEDYINAYDAPIRNVGEPELSNDAATKNYVDTHQAVAGDGRLTIKQGTTTAGTFTANQSADTTITLSAPNNPTITIQKNGSQVTTFTLNQATAKTVNIPVGNGALTIKQNGQTKGTFYADQTGSTNVDLSSSNVSIYNGSDTPFSRDLSVIRVTNDEYNRLVVESRTSESAVYVIEDDYSSMRGAQIRDVGAPTRANDAATKAYVDQNAGSTIIRTWSGTAPISTDREVDLVINRLTKAQYDALSAQGRTSEDQIYMVSDPEIDANNQRIMNVGEPSLSSDAATKNYVDTQKYYELVNANFSSGNLITIDSNTITHIPVTSSIPAGTGIKMPAKPNGNAVRDFMVVIDSTASSSMTLTVQGQSGETVVFLSDDDDWRVIEPGTNILSFTEIYRAGSSSKFLVSKKTY